MRRHNAIPHNSTEYVRRAGKWAWLSAVFIFVCLSTPTPAAEVIVVQGKMVRLKLHDVLTTENVMKGDPIAFDVAEDVVVASHVVIQKGAPASGKVVAVKGAGKRNAKDASVTFEFVSVQSVDNQPIKLRKLPDRRKKTESKENEVEANDPLPGYAQRVIGAEKGKEYVAYVDASITVNAPDTPVAAPPIEAVAPSQPPPAASQEGAQSTSAGRQMPAAAAPIAPTPEEQALVTFDSNPPGADILIDGVLVGNTPSRLHVDAGHHIIQLRIGGYTSWTRETVIGPGSYPSIHVTLEKQ